MTAPAVELRFNPTELRPQDLSHAGVFLGSPADALEAALSMARARMVTRMKQEARGLTAPTHGQLIRLADLAWQAVMWDFRRVSAPVIADAYVRAYRHADAGDVPMSLVMDLADKHAEKIGEYFHSSSREALAEGFNGMVNRRLPAKMAADQVLDAYGLTRRQMRGYTSASHFRTPVTDVLPRPLKARAREYVDKAFTTRLRKLSQQEEHNIDQQAQQFAWMWLQDKGRLSEKAQKLWITARDERVCEICGPLHGKRVLVNERFTTSHGEFWTPGLHPNCRCEVRLLEHRFTKSAFGVITKADEWDPKEHPRGGDPKNRGRFSRRPGPEFKEPPRGPVIQPAEEVIKPGPVIEPAPEKISMVGKPPTEEGKISMGGGKVSMGAGISMGQRLSMGEKVSMGEPAAQTQGKRKVSMEEARELVSQTISPQMKIDMEQNLLRIMMDMQEAPPPPKRPKELYYRPTMWIQDPEGHEYPVYAVVDKLDQINWHGDQLELNHTIEFDPSLSNIISQVGTRFEDMIAAEYSRVMDDSMNVRQIPIGEEMYTLTVPEEDVAAAITYTAYLGRVPKSRRDEFRNETEYFELEGPGGKRIQRAYQLSELARMMGVGRHVFDIEILRMDEGHAFYDGQTTQLEAGTKAGQEKWVTAGTYNVQPYRKERVDATLNVKVNYIEPDVKETRLPNILE